MIPGKGFRLHCEICAIRTDNLPQLQQQLWALPYLLAREGLAIGIENKLGTYNFALTIQPMKGVGL